LREVSRSLDLVTARRAAKKLALLLDPHEQREAAVDVGLDRRGVLQHLFRDRQDRGDLLDRLVVVVRPSADSGLVPALGHTRGARGRRTLGDVADGVGRGLPLHHQVGDRQLLEQLPTSPGTTCGTVAASAPPPPPAAFQQRALGLEADRSGREALAEARRRLVLVDGVLVALRLDERLAAAGIRVFTG
jgi:hypothetical protein